MDKEPKTFWEKWGGYIINFVFAVIIGVLAYFGISVKFDIVANDIQSTLNKQVQLLERVEPSIKQP